MNRAEKVVGITVYGKPNCVQCTMTYRALDAKGIDYDKIDLTEDDGAFAYVTEDLGYAQAPVVVVDDQDHWAGFRPDHIDRIATLAGERKPGRVDHDHTHL
ncbi:MULTISPECIES: glutaredoxin-like protein NrdH [Bacteria]|uniref:glutaredoxin-like protein NrdH n=1 Tax=Bacteria TaxID=2 RepID=UPI003C7B61F9